MRSNKQWKRWNRITNWVYNSQGAIKYYGGSGYTPRLIDNDPSAMVIKTIHHLSWTCFCVVKKCESRNNNSHFALASSSSTVNIPIRLTSSADQDTHYKTIAGINTTQNPFDILQAPDTYLVRSTNKNFDQNSSKSSIKLLQRSLDPPVPGITPSRVWARASCSN